MIENIFAKENFLLKGNSHHSLMTGEVIDISNLCNFKWYEWVKFRKPGEQYPYPTEHLARCLGPAVNKGNAMSQNVLTESREIIPTQTGVLSCGNLGEALPAVTSHNVARLLPPRPEIGIYCRPAPSCSPPSQIQYDMLCLI